jgi:hypothetical protein
MRGADPTSSVLYGIVREHFETFCAQAASLRDGDGLPKFVEQEFRDFLRCGCLAGGFARFRWWRSSRGGSRGSSSGAGSRAAPRTGRPRTRGRRRRRSWRRWRPRRSTGVAMGPRAGARVRRCGDPAEDVAPTTLGPCHARVDGFDLHAGLVVRAGHRDRLERVCRYALRPPLAQERLHRTRDGEIWLTLRHRWADGTTHLRFDPLELLERLAVLTPRPRVNLVLYYGVLAPRALWRGAMVPGIADGVDAREEPAPEDGDASCAKPSRAGAYQWAELMRRTFGVDV